jgi:DNA-binding protein HU-beta
MTKNELVRELAEELEIPRKDIAGIVEALLAKMTGILKAGDKVQLTPFGQFKVRDRAARIARNPQTGEPVNVPAKRVLKFIAGKPLKEAVGTPKRGAAKKAAPARKKAAGTSRKGAAPARKAAPLRKASSGKAKR